MEFSRKSVSLVVCLAGFLCFAAAHKSRNHPVIYFPGYGGSQLLFTANFTTPSTIPGCESSPPGIYPLLLSSTDYTPLLLSGLSPQCIAAIISNTYDPAKKNERVRKGFAPPRGVTVSVPFYGEPECAPFYTNETLAVAVGVPLLVGMYKALVAAGYKVGHDLAFACYDYRVSPDMDVTRGHRFLRETQRLVRRLFKRTGRPVYLMGHSNGGPYAKYVAQASSRKWKRKYLAGLIGLAGSFGGQGGIYGSQLDPFSGPVIQTWTSSYSGAAMPDVYGDSVVFAKDASTGKSYTPRNATAFFRDAHLALGAELFPRFNGVYSPKIYPNVDTYIFYGSGVLTIVGNVFSNLTLEAETLDVTTYLGDGDQEYPDNLAALVWRKMQCHRFQATELPGTMHNELPGTTTVVNAVMKILKTKPKKCDLGTY